MLQHYETTADAEFLGDYGAEVLLEIARSLAGRSAQDRERDRYVIGA